MARKNRGSNRRGRATPSSGADAGFKDRQPGYGTGTPRAQAPGDTPSQATPLPVGQTATSASNGRVSRTQKINAKQDLSPPNQGSSQQPAPSGAGIGAAVPSMGRDSDYGTGGTKPRRPGAGRPRNIEKEYTVVTGGQMVAWPTPIPGVRGSYEQYRPDDLLGRYGFRIYKEMEHDDTVKAILKFKKLLVHGRTWDIIPAHGEDASDQDKAIADFVFDNLNAVNWNRIQREMLTCLNYGFSLGEIIWKVDDYEGGGLKVQLDNVHFRDPEYIRHEIDLAGNITQHRQISSYVPPYQIEIPPEKVLHIAYQGDFQNHYGWSDLRAAYRSWWSKKFVTQFWNVFLERFGSPMMAMKYPQGASDQLKAALQNILTGLQSKTDILIPEGVVIELIEATRGGQVDYDAALRYFDDGIARAMLLPGLLGMGDRTQRAADSQSRLQLRLVMKMAQDLSSDLEWEINQKLVKQLVDFNFNDVDEYPQYAYGDYGEYESAEIIDAITQMFNAGMLDMDQDDVNYVRSISGLPVRDPDENPDEIMRPQPTPLGNPGNGMAGPGGAAGKLGGGAGPNQGNKRAKKSAGARKNK